VKAVATSALAHRVIVAPERRLGPGATRALVDAILGRVEVPVAVG
jgi:hypothetical protein